MVTAEVLSDWDNGVVDLDQRFVYCMTRRNKRCCDVRDSGL